MKIFENRCCGCETCIGCYRSHVEVRICDKCKDDSILYNFYGNEFCFSCFIDEIYNSFLKDVTVEELINFVETLFEISLFYDKELNVFIYEGECYSKNEVLIGIYKDLQYTNAEKIIERLNID